MTMSAIAGDAKRPVRHSSGDQAALYIRRLIFDGALRPDERVPQDEIARALGFSRIPVREALIALEREGWVTIELHRGAFINALSEQALRDHYELYGVVYGFAAQRALARSGVEMLDRLATIVDRLPDDENPSEMGHWTIAFHDTLVEGAGSPRIKVVLRAMSGMVPGNFFALVPGSTAIERRGLTAILRALRNNDGDRAAEEYCSMMRKQGDRVVSLFAARGLLDTPDGQP